VPCCPLPFPPKKNPRACCKEKEGRTAALPSFGVYVSPEGESPRPERRKKGGKRYSRVLPSQKKKKRDPIDGRVSAKIPPEYAGKPGGTGAREEEKEKKGKKKKKGAVVFFLHLASCGQPAQKKEKRKKRGEISVT